MKKSAFEKKYARIYARLTEAELLDRYENSYYYTEDAVKALKKEMERRDLKPQDIIPDAKKIRIENDIYDYEKIKSFDFSVLLSIIAFITGSISLFHLGISFLSYVFSSGVSPAEKLITVEYTEYLKFGILLIVSLLATIAKKTIQINKRNIKIYNLQLLNSKR